MAVVSFKEIADGAGAQSSGPDNSSITRVFRVTCDSKYDNALSIQPSMPIDYNTTLTGFPNFVCQSVNYDREHIGPNFSTHILSYEFRTSVIDQEKLDRQQFPNPLDRRARVTVNSARYSKLINKDINGKAFMTSAGETYPAQEVDDDRWVIAVSKNYVTVPSFVYEYQKKINDAPVTVKGRLLEEKTVKFGETRVSELIKENGVEHYKVEFSLDYKRDGWGLSLLDAGMFYKDGTKLSECWVYEQDGTTKVPASTPILLDGAGAMLHVTLNRTVTDADETFYNDYEVYETADFSTLPLDES